MRKRERLGAFALALMMIVGVLPVGLSVEAGAIHNTDGLTPEMAEAYLNVIDNYIAEYGVYSMPNFKHVRNDRGSGISGFIGGVLQDMNGDSRPEFIALTVEADTFDTCYIDIWQEINGTAQRFQRMEWALALQRSGAYAISLNEGSKATCIRIHSEGVANAGAQWDCYDTFYAMGGLELEVKLVTCSSYDTLSSEYTYSVDGNNCSQAECVEQITPYIAGFETHLFDDSGYSVMSIDELRSELGQAEETSSTGTESGSEALSKPLLNTTGLTSEAAKAYLDVVDGLISQHGGYTKTSFIGYNPESTGFAGGTLVDIDRDGKPEMVTVSTEYDYNSFSHVSVWTYDGGAKSLFNYDVFLNSSDSSIEFSLYEKGGRIYYEASGFSYGFDGDVSWGTIFTVDRGAYRQLLTYNYVTPISYNEQSGDYEYDYRNAFANITDEQGKNYTCGENEFNSLMAQYRNGRTLLNVSEFFGEMQLGFEPNGKEMRSVLEEAAKGAYSYPTADTVDDAQTIEDIASAVAAELGGEVKGIYKLAEGVYYVLIVVDGSDKGVLVKGVKESGQVKWKVEEVHDTPAPQERLDKTLDSIQSTSNMDLDYSRLQNVTVDKALGYLQDELDNMPGLTPNDPAKSQLADYIKSAISSACTTAVVGKDNRLTLDADKVAALSQQAIAAKGQFESVLDENEVSLNKAITIIIRVLWQNMDSGSACQVALDEALLGSMNGCSLQLLLGDAQHYLQLSAENLETLISRHGCVYVQLVKEDTGMYTINFLDESEQLIDRLDVPVTVGLPAESDLSTIMVSYSGGSANWGGQYDPNAQLISFDAAYSGKYEVLENGVAISDIEGLDEQTQQAIAFLVSKGYMDLEDGAFRPDDVLSRYEFSRAMVGMFFALDTTLETSFPDVPNSSPYYAYVASGEALDLLKGFEDGSFGGKKDITVEQMLALAARTLIERKAYSEPEDAMEYLRAFSDGDAVADWARSQTALSIREGLVDRGGELEPQSGVRRSQAALILYRLFLLLHEVPAVALDLPAVTEDAQTPGEDTEAEDEEGAKAPADEAEGLSGGVKLAIASLCLAVFGGGAAGGYLFIRKRSKK